MWKVSHFFVVWDLKVPIHVDFKMFVILLFFFLPPNVCTVCIYCRGLESTLEVFLPPCHSFETHWLRTFCLYYSYDVPFIMYLNSLKWVLLFWLSDFCCFLSQVSCSPSWPGLTELRLPLPSEPTEAVSQGVVVVVVLSFLLILFSSFSSEPLLLTPLTFSLELICRKKPKTQFCFVFVLLFFFKQFTYSYLCE